MEMEARNIAQWYAIFSCVKLGDSATTTHGKLQQAFEDDAMSTTQAFRWHKMFSEGRNIVEDEQRSGRPSTTLTSDNTARVRELVRSDRRLTVSVIADEVHVNREAVRRILTEELGKRKICAKILPRNLTEQQRDARVSFCAELLEQVEADPELMERVITGDESWFFQYDPETKRQSLEWRSKGSPRPKKARMSKSKLKYMLVCFFDSMDILHKEWIPAGKTANQYYYKDILERLGHAGSSKHCHKLDPLSQCASPCSIPCSAVFDIQRHYDDEAPSLITYLAPCDFFLF